VRHQEGLEFLSLQNVGASVHACKALGELLVHTQALSGLHLFNNMSGDEGAGHIGALLARCPAMATFKMASSRVGPEGGIALAKGLSASESCFGGAEVLGEERSGLAEAGSARRWTASRACWGTPTAHSSALRQTSPNLPPRPWLAVQSC
jgi:hypothetical protein